MSRTNDETSYDGLTKDVDGGTFLIACIFGGGLNPQPDARLELNLGLPAIPIASLPMVASCFGPRSDLMVGIYNSGLCAIEKIS